MWILATLSDVEALEVLTRLFPLKVRLSDDPSRERFFILEAPSEVAFVEARGLRVATSGRITWSLRVGTLVVTILHLRMLLVPSIAMVGDHAVLRFVAEVEALDVEWVPELVDQKIAELITQKLCAQPIEWDFTKTLTHTFALPDAIDPPREIVTSVREPSCTVTDTALALALYMAWLPSLVVPPGRA